MHRSLRVFLALTSVFGAAALAAASAATEASDVAHHPFSTDFPSGSHLQVHARSGDVRIIGTDEHRISVEISGRNASVARDIHVRMKSGAGESDLRVSGGPKNDIRITVRIPRITDLYVRVPFGDVEIEDVVGDKDVALHAGDLTISVGNPADYGHVRASVLSGDLSGAPFGEEHGGLFRSFEKEGPGKYRLHAHVGAGDLTLR